MRRWIDVDGNAVLRVLAERSGLTWSELCDELGLGQVRAGFMDLLWCLMDLARLGLISIDGVDSKEIEYVIEGDLEEGHAKSKIRASKWWHDIEMVLTKRYLGARRGHASQPVVVTPLFGSPLNLPQQMDVFVIMPFSEAMLPLYTEHILPVAESLQLTCGRADDLFSAGSLMSDIWSGICGTGAVVCDCTGRNPNVFYELGMAHTVGKPVVLITQNEGDVPVDVRHMKYIKYVYSTDGLREFDAALRSALTMMRTLY